MFLNTKEYSSFWLNGEQYSKGFLNGKQIFGDVYDAATLAIISAANSKGYALPTNLTPLDYLIKNLKTISDGAFWNRMDSIHLSSVIGNSTTHHGLRKLNIKNPSGQERVFYGGLSLNSYGGIQGNGTNAYIDHVTPLSSYANFKQNDAGVIVVKTVDVAAILTSKHLSQTSLNILLRGDNNGIQRINTVDNSTVFDTSGVGAIGLSRISSTIQSGYNKTLKTDISTTSSAVSNQSLWQFRNQNSPTSYYAGDDLAVLVGASYTQAELNIFRTYFNQYLTESGFSAIA